VRAEDELPQAPRNPPHGGDGNRWPRLRRKLSACGWRSTGPAGASRT